MGKFSQWYASKAWRKVRAYHLKSESLCVFCREAGRLTPATVVDHIKPHRGNKTLFWDAANLQSLCKLCHDSVKQSLENGKSKVIGLDGWPIESK